jgi:hypothetical protein
MSRSRARPAPTRGTVSAWLSRKAALSGIHTQRAVELTAFVLDMARNVNAASLVKMA